MAATVIVSPEVAGAILALGFATDETTARYWLSTAARRGADQPLLDQLWRAWQAQNRPTVLPTRAPRCDRCGGPLGGARCPLCDPRPNTADRAAGCVCPDGRGRPARDWQPVSGCPVHDPNRREDLTP